MLKISTEKTKNNNIKSIYDNANSYDNISSFYNYSSYDNTSNNINSCLTDPLKKHDNTLGKHKHYPSANQEWINSIYCYNNRYSKTLPAVNKVVNKLLKSYFNLSAMLIRIKSKRSHIRLKRRSTKRTFVSTAEIKHFNDKVFITVFTYNRHLAYLHQKLKKLFKFNKNSLKNKLNKYLRVFLYTNKEKDLLFKSLHLNYSFSLNETKSKKLNKKLFKKLFKKEIFYMYYILMIYINKYKYENSFLFGVKSLISKVLKKKVEFNIVNLKYLHLNSDIFSQAISIKVKNRNNRILKIMKRALSLVKLPNFNKYLNNEINERSLNLDLLSYSLNSIDDKDALHKVINELHQKSYNTLYNPYKSNLSNFVKDVLISLKHKAISGVRLEGAGRLTKRLTASRSIFKIKYKGSLKNIYSSYKNLKAVMLRGHVKSNLEYSIINSKTRNGSFGLKAWVSGY